VLALGSEVEIAELMALMAGLIIATHVLVGLSIAQRQGSDTAL